ncbi:MAG: O-antigen ligase family protein [Comamonadaceae bacterium]|nr:MAG: O-antigen ligase family protein [Comamonadaceae bacterium]
MEKKEVLSGCLVAVILFFLPTVDLTKLGSWHDYQRVGQVVIFFIAVVFVGVHGKIAVSKIRTWDPVSRYCTLAVGVLGFGSSLNSVEPGWAFAEFSLFVCSIALLLMVQSSRAVIESFDIWMLRIVYLVCGALCFQFFISYSSVIFDNSVVNPVLLLSGFDNPRSFGQFCTITIPILIYPLFGSLRRLQAFTFLSVWWALALASGTRGTWVALFFTGVSFFVFGGTTGRRWAFWLFATGGVGAVMCLVLLSGLPWLFDLPIADAPSERFTTTLSGRDSLWSQAYWMFIESPLLGHGPMHFAYFPNKYGAHPHNVILQWLSEWGVFSSVFLMVIGARLGWSGMKKIRAGYLEANQLFVCIFAALFAIAVQGMVDGVLVVPYTQLWVFVVLAWTADVGQDNGTVRSICKLHSRKNLFNIKSMHWILIFMVMICCAIYLCIVVYKGLIAPDLRTVVPEDYSAIAYRPRFWLQGIIANSH